MSGRGGASNLGAKGSREGAVMCLRPSDAAIQEKRNLPDGAWHPGVPLACAQGGGHLSRLCGEVRAVPGRVWMLGVLLLAGLLPRWGWDWE